MHAYAQPRTEAFHEHTTDAAVGVDDPFYVIIIIDRQSTYMLSHDSSEERRSHEITLPSGCQIPTPNSNPDLRIII